MRGSAVETGAALVATATVLSQYRTPERAWHVPWVSIARLWTAGQGSSAGVADARPRLLVVDEVGYLSYSNRHADLLFEIVSRRYEVKSTLITTNRPFAEWGEVFPNAACVVSLVDRLVHHAEIIVIQGESYRLKEAKERSDQRLRARAATRPKKPADPQP
jgi:IstB-like ATP binding protein